MRCHWSLDLASSSSGPSFLSFHTSKSRLQMSPSNAVVATSQLSASPFPPTVSCRRSSPAGTLPRYHHEHRYVLRYVSDACCVVLGQDKDIDHSISAHGLTSTGSGNFSTFNCQLEIRKGRPQYAWTKMRSCSPRSVCQNHSNSPGGSGRAERTHVETSGSPSKVCSLGHVPTCAEEDIKEIISESHALSGTHVPFFLRMYNFNQWRRANGK